MLRGPSRKTAKRLSCTEQEVVAVEEFGAPQPSYFSTLASEDGNDLFDGRVNFAADSQGETSFAWGGGQLPGMVSKKSPAVDTLEWPWIHWAERLENRFLRTDSSSPGLRQSQLSASQTHGYQPEPSTDPRLSLDQRKYRDAGAAAEDPFFFEPL